MCPFSRSKRRPSLRVSGESRAARVSSELPWVSVEGWGSMQSGSHTPANIHGGAPERKEGPSDLAWRFRAAPCWGREGMKAYLSPLEAPRAFSSRAAAFCRGYWGRGTPCSRGETHHQPHCGDCPDVENVLGHSHGVPGCSVHLAVYCPWTSAEDRRHVPWNNCPHQCGCHCLQRGHWALQDKVETLSTSAWASTPSLLPPSTGAGSEITTTPWG